MFGSLVRERVYPERRRGPSRTPSVAAGTASSPGGRRSSSRSRPRGRSSRRSTWRPGSSPCTAGPIGTSWRRHPLPRVG